MGLELKKEVICLVESIEDQRNLGTNLLDFAKSSNEIRTWAGIPNEQPDQPPEPNVNNQRTTTERPNHRGGGSAKDFLDLERSM